MDFDTWLRTKANYKGGGKPMSSYILSDFRSQYYRYKELKRLGCNIFDYTKNKI